ncbi:MAG: hypothetical protein KGQ59_06580 [Bdellovibrionales bacterium]|nr:hypothetical protein [Bdellovibrionales bacterium]
MVYALKVFAEAILSLRPNSLERPIQIRYWGSSWAEAALPAFSRLGWQASTQEPGARLEFFSLPRESQDGVFIEELPLGFSAERVQRLFAASFQGLRPKGILFVGFRDHSPVALLTWLRQSGFESLQQGQSDELQGILAQRIA